MRGRPQRLGGVHRAAVAHERHHRPLRQRQLDAERGRQTPADAAASQAEQRLAVRAAEEVPDARRRRDRLVDDDCLVRHRLRHGVDERQRAHRRLLRLVGGAACEVVALLPLCGGQRVAALRRVLVPGLARVAAHRLAQLGQRRLRIALDGDGGRIVLADLPRVDVEMHDVQPVRHRIDVRRQREREEVAAHGEQQVVAHEQALDAGAQPRHGAGVERVREREAARGGHALQHHGRADQLGQLHHLGERVAMGHRVADDEQRLVGGHELACCGIDGRAVADDPRGDAGRRHEIHVLLGVQHVDGQGEEHGPGRLSERRLHGAAHDARQVIEPARLRGPLHVRRGHRRQIGPENRLRHREALIVLPGGEQERGVGLERVVQHAHRVPEPGRDVHVHGGERAAGLRVSVGHRDRHRLLERQDVADPRLTRETVHQWQLGGAGVAEHHGHAFADEDLQERLLAGKVGHGAGS